jgi:hypothetical protein
MPCFAAHAILEEPFGLEATIDQWHFSDMPVFRQLAGRSRGVRPHILADHRSMCALTIWRERTPWTVAELPF